jgi:hypothetical protein
VLMFDVDKQVSEFHSSWAPEMRRSLGVELR